MKNARTLLAVCALLVALSTGAIAQDVPGTINFPGSADSVVSLFETANNAATTLTAPATDADVTIAVASTALFPATGALSIDNEIVYYTGKTPTTFTGLVRGRQGTTAAAHLAAAAVQARYTAGHHSVLRDTLILIEEKIGMGSSTPAAGKFLAGNGAGTSTWREPAAADLSDGTTGSGSVVLAQNPSFTANLYLPATSSTAGILYIGGLPFLHAYEPLGGGTDTFVGISSGNFTMAGCNNNTGIGYQALANNTGGYVNTAVGVQALQANTSGVFNTAIGMWALNATTTASNNVAVGFNALKGGGSLGDFNVAVGNSTLSSATNSGGGNTAVGNQALGGNTTASGNTAVGNQALLANTSGTHLVAVGSLALSESTGDGNTAVGELAGYQNASANRYVTADSYLTLLGYYASKNTAATITNSTALGNGAEVTASNQMVFGNSSVTANIFHGTITTGDSSLSSDLLDFTNAGAPATIRAADGLTLNAINGTWLNLALNGASTLALNGGTGDVVIKDIRNLSWGSSGVTSPDLFIGRRGPATLQVGAKDSATPVPQTLTFQGSRGGTDTNTAGAAATIQCSLGTGAAAVKPCNVTAAAQGTASGTTQHTAVLRHGVNWFVQPANNTVTTAAQVTAASDTTAAVIVDYSVEVNDGASHHQQNEVGRAICNVANSNGTISVGGTNGCSQVYSQQVISASGGTLTVTWTLTAANPALLQVNANSSLTPAAGFPRVTYEITNLAQQAVTEQ